VVLEVGSWLWFNLGPCTSLSKYGAHKGAFVLITGASEGIGRGIAAEAAKRGFNLVIVSRTKDNLETLSTEIRQLYPKAVVRVVAADCSVDAPSTYEAILDAVRDVRVTILVNNVASANDNSDPIAVDVQSGEAITRIVTLNCTFLSKLTSLMIPLIEKSRAEMEKQHNCACRGCIVNVSSFLSILPAGYFSMYSSTKQFVNQFSDCLRCELYDSQIDVTTIVPAHVCSKMSKISTPSLMVPDASTFAVCVWNKIGKAGLILPYLPHALMAAFANLMPKWFLIKSLRDELKPKK
jgi:17beta-estradiol 17-dehydrogenase / very-long-chain 3-oxoacyl-CoA reductase